jgi:hypothetical protein
VDQYHTIPVPAECVTPEGTLQLAFINDPMVQDRQFEGSARFEGDDALQVLYRVGTFEGNLARALSMVLVMLMFFAALGLMASTFLSFPVAVLVVMMIFVFGAMTEFLLGSTSLQNWMPGPDDLLGPLSYVLHPLGHFWLTLVPHLNNYNPVSTFSDGRNVSLVWIGLAVRDLVLVRGGIVALLALWLFHRRELAEVIV